MRILPTEVASWLISNVDYTEKGIQLVPTGQPARERRKSSRPPEGYHTEAGTAALLR